MVSSKQLLSATAGLFAAGGVVMLFIPDTVLGVLGAGPKAPSWSVQLLAAAWWGFAALNWASRGAIVGGIYGRPLVVANWTHFLIGTLVLGRAALAGALGLVTWTVLGILVLFAGAFGVRLFVGPPEWELARSRAS